MPDFDPGREEVLPQLGRSAAIFHSLRQPRGVIADPAQSLFSTAKGGDCLPVFYSNNYWEKS
jgi:hypothetical protein